MNTSDNLRALRRANPRDRAGFARAVEAAEEQVRTAIAADGVPAPAQPRLESRRRLARRAAAVGLIAVAAAAALASVGSIGGGGGVESATAAVERATMATAASAERSGTAEVVMRHNGELWARKTVRWNGGDVAITEESPNRFGRAGRGLFVVDGTMYGPDADGSWLVLGSPSSIDPDSGTTPDEHLAAVRADIGGGTLRRITGGVSGLTTSSLADGSTVYRGTVAAGLFARETGFKEGEAIRVLPFGYVANDATDAAAPLDVAVTVGADGLVRSIAASWGTSASAWTYTVTYRELGTTAPIAAPANARPLKRAVRGG